MRRRGAARSWLALAATLVAYELIASRFLLGVRTGWGVLIVVVLSGAGLALVFTVVYDGPRALARLARPTHGGGESGDR